MPALLPVDVPISPSQQMGRRAKMMDSVPSLMRGGRTRVAPMGRRRKQEQLRPMPVDEGAQMLVVSSPRSPSFGSAGGGWQSPGGAIGGASLPPIRGLPARASPSASSRGKQVSPYASAPQSLLPQINPVSVALRSPAFSPKRRNHSPPLGVQTSPPTLEAPAGGTFFSKARLGARSRVLDVSAQRLTFEMYARIASPAKLHAHQPSTCATPPRTPHATCPRTVHTPPHRAQEGGAAPSTSAHVP
jgi:hypothetical protein